MTVELIKAARAWCQRAAGQLDPADLLRLSPVGAIRTLFSFSRARRLGRVAAAPRHDDLGARDPEFVRLAVDLFRAIGTHYFRLQIRGVEHVPQAGPALLVGSHNGGMLAFDTVFTMVAVWDRFGPSRALYPLAHDLAFHHPATAKYAPRMGVLRAGHGAGSSALRAGELVLVYPGSDLDSYRPFRDRHRIELGGRTGFLKLALRERVPIIPVVSVGTHEQIIVLTRGDRLARLINTRRHLRASVCPIVISLPWGLTSGYFPYLPLPAQTTIAFGPPLRLPEVELAQIEDPALLARCYAMVRDHLQAEMDRLSAGRVPFLGTWPHR